MKIDSTRIYGKYSGTVSDNADPLTQGRIRATDVAILEGEETGWALPCTPFAGPGVGFFFLPPVGAKVWIEFEAGKVEHPIWSGCFWRDGEASTMLSSLPNSPSSSDAPKTKVIKTEKATLSLSDLTSAQGITIEITTGLKIEMVNNTVTISNGNSTLELTSSDVAINRPALEIK
ncbi:MAG: phage baseplate assembly protein V [Candidatus Nitrosopolaris sp.]